MAAARLALRDYEDGPGYDWGVPALYLRVPEMRLVDPTQNPKGLQDPSGLTLTNVSGLPLPRHFVGRKPQLRRMRRALKQRHVNSIFVRGIGGIGKSSIAAKLIERPGVKLDGVLVIRCHEVDPLDIPTKIAGFLMGQGEPGHADAGKLMLHAPADPIDRARQAAQLVSGKRYLFVFDNFESLQSPLSDPQSPIPNPQSPISDPTLRGLFEGLLTANWHSVCLFTGRYRWRGYDEYVGRGTAILIHLPGLTARQTIMMMDNLSRLRQLPVKTKIALFRKVGGHPKTIELLNGWLAAETVRSLLDDAQLDDRLAQEWEAYFLRDLLAQLPLDERRRLGRLAIFQGVLSEAALEYAEIDRGIVSRWLDLSLMQKEAGGPAPQLPPEMAALLDMLPPAEQAKLTGGAPRYSVHPVVADYLLGQTSAEERQELHRWAAAFYGQPFVQMARDYATRTNQNWTDERIEWFARDRRGVVGQLVAQTDDMAQARGAMARALDWQRHLFAAGEVDAADDIVNAVVDILARWGERDRAKGLLRRSIASLEGGNKAVAEMNLATLLKDEGKLDEALATYRDVYETFAALDAKQQMAIALNMQSQVLQLMGRIDEAISNQEASLRIKEKEGIEEGQAISLHQLSILYEMKEDYETALARSHTAEVLDRKRSDQAGLAADLHEQGIIYTKMAREVSSDKAKTYRETAVSRFRDSLAISRCIKNESDVANTLGELGKLLQDAEQMNEAIAAFKEANAIFTRMGNPAKIALTLEDMGHIHERQGQYAAALSKYREALALFQQYSSPQEVARCQRNIALLQSEMGQ